MRVGIEQGEYFANFLFYVVTAAVAGFRTTDPALESALVVVLAAASGAKYWLSARLARDQLREPPRWFLFAVALLAGTFSLPTSTAYLGQLPPNVFHNSTTIFVMLFAVALFMARARYLEAPGRRPLALIFATAALNVAIKPSFVFAVIIVLPIAAAVRFGTSSARAAFGAHRGGACARSAGTRTTASLDRSRRLVPDRKPVPPRPLTARAERHEPVEPRRA